MPGWQYGTVVEVTAPQPHSWGWGVELTIGQHPVFHRSWRLLRTLPLDSISWAGDGLGRVGDGGGDGSRTGALKTPSALGNGV